jgi:hypothetical protein
MTHTDRPPPPPRIDTDDFEPIEVRETRVGSALQVLLSLVLIVLGVWIGVTGPEVPLRIFELLPPRFWGFLTAGFFSVTGVHGVTGLLRKDPVLVIDGDGIEDRRTWFSAGRVRWDEIADVESVRFRMVAVRLTEAESVLERLPLWKRWFLRLDHWIFGTPVHLALGGLEGGREALLETLQHGLERVQVADVRAAAKLQAPPDATAEASEADISPPP